MPVLGFLDIFINIIGIYSGNVTRYLQGYKFSIYTIFDAAITILKQVCTVLMQYHSSTTLLLNSNFDHVIVLFAKTNE